MYLLEKQLKKYQTFSCESDIPGIYKRYYTKSNSSETTLNLIFFYFIPKTGSFVRFLLNFK